MKCLTSTMPRRKKVKRSTLMDLIIRIAPGAPWLRTDPKSERTTGTSRAIGQSLSASILLPWVRTAMAPRRPARRRRARRAAKEGALRKLRTLEEDTWKDH